MNYSKKKKRRTRNLLCVILCSIILLLTIVLITLLTKALKRDEFATDSPLGENVGTESLLNTESMMNDTEAPEEPKNSLIVCLDAGHGGKDNGTDNGTRFEKDDTLALTLLIRDYLESNDINVVMTREDDIFWKLSQRCKIANEANADYFVSLHRNEGEGYGAETWISKLDGEEANSLAKEILRNLETAGISRNRGVKYGSQSSEDEDFAINRDSNMTSCIIELGFINSDEDNQLFDEHINDYAVAIGDAIIQTATTYQADKMGISSDGETTGTEVSNSQVSTSHTLNNTQIPNIESLDATSKDWGQGSNTDELNRPDGCLYYQQLYGQYNAYFIDDTEEKIIYLTFDEGYEYGYTPSILDTLKEKDVQAVFFVTKPYAEADPQYVRRMIDEGHMVGNHSVTHPSMGLPSQTLEDQEYEVTETHRYVKENFDYDMHLFRYPTGRFSEQSLALLNNCNYKSVFWSFAYLDYDVNNQPDEAESLQKCIDKLHPGAIYLLHAESQTNANILGDFIDAARAQGYEFRLFD